MAPPASARAICKTSVADVLHRFLPNFLKQSPALNADQWRAIRSITQCRTPAMGGRRFACAGCGREHFAFHSCNHKACPQCGRAATAKWVERELGKRIGAPYFMVTITLPEELRINFFGPLAKDYYALFFTAASGALQEKLTNAKGFKAVINGFTAVLHTWNQRLGFHPHLHILVPGAGINAKGRVIKVKRDDYLLYVPLLQGAVREHFCKRMEERKWGFNPAVWHKEWQVDIAPFGSGEAALKYLGTYVARTAIADSRIVSIQEDSVTYRWKDRDTGMTHLDTITGVEFCTRYMRHVLPHGLRSIRYYGYCHPAAKCNRERVRMHTGMPIRVGPPPAMAAAASPSTTPCCPDCKTPMQLTGHLPRQSAMMDGSRGPPGEYPWLDKHNMALLC